MDLNILSKAYVECLFGRKSVEGGMLFINNIDTSKLNGSYDSLKYIDEILDLLHESGVTIDEVLGSQSGQNFLYAIAFYTGSVVGNENGKPVTWITYEQFKNVNSEVANQIGNGFETSIIYMTDKNTMFPLPSIMTRLFEGPEEKSVWYSTGMAIIPKSTKPKWKLW